MLRNKILNMMLVVLLILAVLLPAGFTTAIEDYNNNSYLLEEKSEIAEAKISSEVKESIETFSDDEPIEILILLKEQTDTARVAEKARQKIPPWASAQQQKMQSRAAVVNALQDTADRTQGNLISYLAREQGLGKVEEYKSFFIVNIIYARVTAGVIEEISRRPEVDQILPDAKIELIEPVVELEEAEISDNASTLSMGSVEWNIDLVGAPEVWNKYGIDGTGVVIGIIDTGVHWEHEALKKKWRGYNPVDPNNADPIYSWFDAVEESILPVDDVGHGTHVTGIALGSDPENENPIGVAPGAQWIAARAFNEWGGSDSWILAAAEYMLAPTDENGVPNPEMAPDIINNSWGSTSPGLREWFRPMVQTWRDADILPVFAAGNDGPDEGTVNAPANYPESFAVGATWYYNLATFSSRGPSPYNEPDDLKPDICAPGLGIRSSVPDGYDGASGTSMAAPHTAGVAALLLSSDYALDINQIETLMINSAVPLFDANYPEYPNYGYGYGLINALDAVCFSQEGYGKIIGEVVAGEENEPVPGALVTVKETGRSVQVNPADGTFTLYHQTGQDLTLQVESYGYNTSKFVFNLDDGEILDLGIITLQEASLVMGQIVDLDYNPLKATVAVLETGYTFNTNPLDGSFSFYHPSGEGWTLQLTSYGYSTFQQQFNLEENEELDLGYIVLHEAPTGTLSGTVVDKVSGEPVAGAAVTLVDVPDTTYSHTAADGSFQLNDIYEGSYTVWASEDIYHTASAQAVVTGDATTELHFELEQYNLVAKFEADIINGQVPLDVQFTDTSIGVPEGWAWYFGDEKFSDQWIEMTDQAEWEGRSNHQAVVLPDGNIVLMGGKNDLNSRNRDVWRSTDQGITWEQMTASAEWSRRSNFSCIALPDGSIVLMGGYIPNLGYMNDVWRSTDQGVTWSLMTEEPGWESRIRAKSVVLPDGSILLLGGSGLDESGQITLKDVWRSFDQGASWKELNTVIPGLGTPLVLPDGSIVLLGSNDVWRSNDYGTTWEHINEEPEWVTRSGYGGFRGSHSSVVLPDGSIVIMGGFDRYDNSHQNDVWRSIDQGGSWSLINENSEWAKRSSHTSLAMPDGSVVIIGGEGSDNNVLSDVWRWETAGSSNKDPSHTYNEPGIYQVVLQVYNKEDYHGARFLDLITVGSSKHIISASSSPVEGGTVSGGGSYEYGEVVTVTAHTAEGYYFLNWTEEGVVVSEYEEYSFTAAADRTLVANFEIKITDYDFELWLSRGWNLVSVPLWTENIDVEDADIEAWLTFLDGRWTSEGVEAELANPAQAVFIKTKQPTVLGFKWKEMRPEYEFARQGLTEGWNLISSGMQASYNTILAHERFDGVEGLTQIYAPNAFNERKDNDYFMPWHHQLISLLDGEGQPEEEMFPFDGYWVYLRGDSTDYSTLVSPELPARGELESVHIHAAYWSGD